MKKSILINLFIKKNNLKKFILNSLILIIIYTILFSFSLLLKVYQNNKLDEYKYSSYSLIINGMEKKYESSIKKYFQNDYMAISIISGAFYSKSGKQCVGDLEVTDDINKCNISEFSDELIIKSKIIDKNLNPIYIDRIMAKSLNVTIGDKIYKKIGKDKKEVTFTVARIYEPLKQGIALTNWQSNQKKFFEESFGTLDVYSKIYIKSTNPKVAGNLINSKINKNLQIIYKDDELKDKIEELEFAPATIIFTSILGFIVFLIFICKESNKWITTNLKNIAIINYLGLSKKTIVIFMFFKNIIIQTVFFSISFIFVKFAVYDAMFKSLYLSSRLLIQFAIIVVLLQVVASLFSCIYTWIKLKKINIITILIKE